MHACMHGYHTMHTCTQLQLYVGRDLFATLAAVASSLERAEDVDARTTAGLADMGTDAKRLRHHLCACMRKHAHVHVLYRAWA